MKKNLLLLAILPLHMISVAQVPKPGKPAFIVTYEEGGKNANASWKYSATVKFSLSASNGWFYVNESGIPDFTKLIDFDPARFLKLEPGSVIGFYPSEVDESGSGDGGHYSRVLTPDGTETVVEKDGMGDRTIITTEADIRRRYGMTTDGSAYNLNARSYQIAGQLAELERTETGAILRAYTAVGDNLGEWGVSQETMEQVFPKVVTFVLTDQDVKAWQQISRTNVASGSGEDEHLTVKLSVKMEVPDLENSEVTLEGCSDLGIGELGLLTALGRPEGGSYRYWAEPSDALTLQADGASVTLEGASPGRATIFVEYSSPKGSTAQATKTASCVEVDSYNNGQPVPQVALYDFEGKHMTGINIPVSMQPSDGADLLKYVPADPAILTVIGLGNEVTIQGIREGKTTFQATTLCGGPTGPAVDVEVVNCDDETIARLEKQRQAATENLQIAAKELQSIAGSPEFEKARNDLVASTYNLLARVALTIISSGKTPSAPVNAFAKIADVGANLSDMLVSDSHEEFFINGVKTAADKIWGETTAALIGLTEVAEAADRFYKNAVEIQLHKDNLKSAWESYEKAMKPLEDVLRRQEICKGDKTEPKKKEEPKADQPPKPPEPTPPTEPKPKTDTPPAKEEPTEEPTTPEPGDEEPPVPPTTPIGETRQVGLPYSPEECGCEESKSISLSSSGFSALQAGIKNLGDCVEKFNSISVTDYSNTLKELAALADTLKTAADGDPAIFGVKAREAKPKLDSLMERAKSYDEAGKTFLQQFDKCPESVSAGMDVLKSAMTVTVDSITTKY